MGNYMISYDRDGSYHLEHAWGKKTGKASVKYIAKIGEGAKARYFYTQEQLKAFQQGTKKKVEDKVGITAKKNIEAAKKTYQNASKNTSVRKEQEKTAQNKFVNSEKIYDEAVKNSLHATKEKRKAQKNVDNIQVALDARRTLVEQAKQNLPENQKWYENLVDYAIDISKKQKLGTEKEKAYRRFTSLAQTEADAAVQLNDAKRKLKQKEKNENDANKKEDEALKAYANASHDYYDAQWKTVSTKMLEDIQHDEYKRVYYKYMNTPLGKVESALDKIHKNKVKSKKSDSFRKWRRDVQTKHTKIESGGGHTAAEWLSEQNKKSKKKEN